MEYWYLSLGWNDILVDIHFKYFHSKLRSSCSEWHFCTYISFIYHMCFLSSANFTYLYIYYSFTLILRFLNILHLFLKMTSLFWHHKNISIKETVTWDSLFSNCEICFIENHLKLYFLIVFTCESIYLLSYRRVKIYDTTFTRQNDSKLWTIILCSPHYWGAIIFCLLI